MAGDGEIQNQTQRKPAPGTNSNQDSFSNITDSKQLDTAAYILEMTLALRGMASDSKLDFLAYLLDMAAEEAEGLVRADIKGSTAKADREIA